MRQKWEGGCVPSQVRCAWLMALGCIVTMGIAPATAWAEEEVLETDEVTPEATMTLPGPAPAVELGEVDDVVTQEELDRAEAAIREAERELEEAKRQMQLMGRKMAPEPEPVPGTGVGLASADGRAKKLQFSLNDDGTLYLSLIHI